MAKSNKNIKKELTDDDKIFIKKFWNLVNIKDLAKRCKVSRDLIYKVKDDDRRDHHNIMIEAYKQITAYMQ
jgi:Mor family transcriptional regulator